MNHERRDVISDSASAVEQPPAAYHVQPRTKHGQAQNWPIITTYDHVQTIL